MKISEQRFIWCRCDASFEDAQKLIEFLTTVSSKYFLGFHSKGKSDKKPPHFHFFVLDLNISQNTFRKKLKELISGEVYIDAKYNSLNLENNIITSAAYILAKDYDVPIWTNLDYDKVKVDIKVIELLNNKKDKKKNSVKQSVNTWLNKVIMNIPEIEVEAAKADTWFTRKLVFKKIFSYIMLDKINNEEYINRNSHNELVYNIFLRLSSLKARKKVVNEASEMVYEKYFGEGPGSIDVSSDQGFGSGFENI